MREMIRSYCGVCCRTLLLHKKVRVKNISDYNTYKQPIGRLVVVIVVQKKGWVLSLYAKIIALRSQIGCVCVGLTVCECVRVFRWVCL